MAASLLSPLFALVLMAGTVAGSSSSFVPTGDLDGPRHSHTSTLLASGKVLIAGGSGTSLLLFDPTSGLFVPAGGMPDAFFGQTATLLADGRVLLAGGSGITGPTARAFIYEPATGTVSELRPMTQSRSQHTATLLGSGKVLVAGGTSTALFVDSAELFDPATATFVPTGNLGIGRRFHTSTLLPNGKVLIAGGFTATGDDTSAELYDPSAGTFTSTGRLNHQRAGNSATLLPNGKVLIAGGSGFVGTLESAELYDLTTGTFVATPNMTAQRDLHSATRLQDGTVLLTGGLDNFGVSQSSAEIYDPAANTFAATAGMSTPRTLQSASLLMDGRVLVAGGFINGDGVLASAELYVTAAGPRTFVVNSAADPGDGACDLRDCTLREAIDAANAHAGIDVITFHIGLGGPQTILPAGPLPAIVDQVVLDATTQPGFAGMPLIELNGALAGPDADGLMVNTDHSTIRGLVIGGFSRNGVFLLGGEDNAITGNFIGTDSSGTYPRTNNGPAGILVIDSANNLIGGTTPAQRNVISGNHHGVYVTGVGSTGNVVVGNFIGTDVSGLHGLGNLPYHGIVFDGASNNRVGGTGPGERNVISANGFYGVQIRSGFFAPFDPATANVVLGNYIGVDATGNTALGNGFDGVAITNTAGNTVGGTSVAARNVISANPHAGVGISQAGATGNVVQGNYIGTDASGSLALGNGAGVDIFGAANNVVGGLAPGAGNVISANGLSGGPAANAGVAIGGTGATGNIVEGNFIGTDASGFGALGNSMGVAISSENNLIGGSAYGARNVISGNVGPGVGLFGNTTTGNRIQGNFIGTSAYGYAPLGNDFGVFMCCGAGHNVIGGAGSGEGNTIASSRHDGISLGGACCNTIQGNYIGTNWEGTSGLGNAQNGIFANFASGNLIGGTPLGARNVISGNGQAGVFILNATAVVVQGNWVGPTPSGILGNGFAGVGVFGSTGTMIGGSATGAGNVISGNGTVGGPGIQIANGSRGTVVQGNFIGTAPDGVSRRGNHGDGVAIQDASDTLIGGADPAARNVISGNDHHGVHVAGAASSDNRIEGNYIGTDRTGSTLAANGASGVHLDQGASNNTVGGTAVGAGNVIAGTGSAGAGGVAMFAGAGGNRVQGNLIGTDATGTRLLGIVGSGININTPNNLVGGTAAGARNVIVGSDCCDGITIQGSSASGNVVQGNYIGLDRSGSIAFGNGFQGIAINGAADNRIGGPDPAARNVIAGAQRFAGVAIFNGAARNIVQGNYIGTDASGTAARANVGWGVAVAFAGADNVVGGSAPGTGNLISGNTRGGVRLSAPTTAALVQGNRIGTTLSGTALGNGGEGILVDGATNSSIGGTQVGAANVIMFNAGVGVSVVSNQGDASGVAILGNSIAANGGLGIDLGADGVTPNDTGDADIGPNTLQNFPIVISAPSRGTNGTIRGRLNSTASTTFRVELFASSSCDPSGFGEGQLFLAATTVTTNGGGNGIFAVDASFAPGWFITATATSPGGNSSEFGKCVQAEAAQ